MLAIRSRELVVPTWSSSISIIIQTKGRSSILFIVKRNSNVREQALSGLHIQVLYEQIEFTKGEKRKIYTGRLYGDGKALCYSHRLAVNKAAAEYLSS